MAALAARQHPRHTALVKPGLGSDINAQYHDQEQRSQRANQPANRPGQLCHPAQRLLGQSLEIPDVNFHAVAFQPGGNPQGLRFNRGGKGSGLLSDLAARKIGYPDHESDADQQDQRDTQAPADRQYAAEQSHSAIDHCREHQPAKDHQQRLRHIDGQYHQPSQPDPYRRALGLMAQQWIGNVGRSGELAGYRGSGRFALGHQLLLASLPCDSILGRKLLQPRPLRKALHQLSGFRLSLPLSEKVRNSARPPMSDNGTGPPRPFS